MRIGNFTVLAENDKPGYRNKSVTLATRTKYNPAAFIQESPAYATIQLDLGVILGRKEYTSTRFLWEQLTIPILVHSRN